MKQKLFAVPLLSLAILATLFQPVDKNETITKALNNMSEKMSKFTPATVTPPALLNSGAQYAPPITPNFIPSIQNYSTSTPTAVPTILSTPTPEPVATKDASSELEDFVDQVKDGQADKVRGLYVPGLMALKVIQQPDNDDTFVSQELGIATQFRSAAENGVTGLLAHNFLSGQLFYNLLVGQRIEMVYGDGSIHEYQIESIDRFQKLDPSSLRSDMIDLSNNKKLSTAQVFNRFYRGGDHVTLQTCLEVEGNPTWGLYFVTALPVN
jgi:hypothetical protein